MTEQEMRELDRWLAENVFHIPKHLISIKGAFQVPGKDYLCREIDRYTTDPAAAMLVMEKCAENVSDAIRYRVSRPAGVHRLSCFEIPEVVAAETLPLAIAKFARQLFGKDAQ